MEIEIEFEEARRRWSYLLNQVAAHGVRVVLLRNGKPIGALIGAADYRFWKAHRRRAEPASLVN